MLGIFITSQEQNCVSMIRLLRVDQSIEFLFYKFYWIRFLIEWVPQAVVEQNLIKSKLVSPSQSESEYEVVQFEPKIFAARHQMEATSSSSSSS